MNRIKKIIISYCFFSMWNLFPQDLEQKLTALTTSLVNLKDALSGKSSHPRPKNPQETAKELIAEPLTPTRDDFKDKIGSGVHGWYGIIQQEGPDKDKFGIYIQEPTDGQLSVESFFDTSGKLVYPWTRGKKYTLFVLYNPKGGANQNESAKKLYEAYIQSTTKKTTTSGPIVTDMKTLFELGGLPPAKEYKIDDKGKKVKLTYGIIKGKKQLGFYVPAVLNDTTIDNFFALKDEVAVKKGDLIYPVDKRDTSTPNYQMFILYDDANPVKNNNAKIIYDNLDLKLSSKSQISKKKTSEEEEEELIEEEQGITG